MGSENEKEVVQRNRVSNEQLMAEITNVMTLLSSMKVDIEELKKRTGFGDKAVRMLPEKQNYNTDTGPFSPVSSNK